MPWELRFFRQARGEEPVRKFLKALPKAVRIEAGAALTELEEKGPELKRPGAAYLRDSIYELRFSAERVEYRILYFFDGKTVVLTNAFVKKVRKIPKEEIERAISRRSLWLAG